MSSYLNGPNPLRISSTSTAKPWWAHFWWPHHNSSPLTSIESLQGGMCNWIRPSLSICFSLLLNSFATSVLLKHEAVRNGFVKGCKTRMTKESFPVTSWQIPLIMADGLRSILREMLVWTFSWCGCCVSLLRNQSMCRPICMNGLIWSLAINRGAQLQWRPLMSSITAHMKVWSPSYS